MVSGTALWTRGDTVRWGSILAVLAVDALWLRLSGRSLAAEALESRLLAFAVLGTLCGLLMLAARASAARGASGRQRLAALAAMMQALAWLVLFLNGMCVLSYLLVTMAPPLIDARLAAIDAALGFRWPAVHAWVRAHPDLSGVLQWCYEGGRMQLLLVPLAIGLFGPAERLREFLSCMMISLALVLLISTPLPASGAYYFFGHLGGVSPAELAQYSHFAPLRDGSLRVFDLNTAQGLVSMPSFHTVMGLVFIRAMWWSRLARFAVLPFNVVMILSTPSQGGHYLVDVLAGVAVWAATFLLVRALHQAREPRPWRAALPAVSLARPRGAMEN
ncbi:phosphatase PAP2 family protein [Cupriavidus sp. 2TAF22]|uniref:phosphatase PAP2 family protein n=1 Tax=unclassified Cupriavidus TaxID=2640874 RepID=UPI003F8F3224